MELSATNCRQEWRLGSKEIGMVSMACRKRVLSTQNRTEEGRGLNTLCCTRRDTCEGVRHGCLPRSNAEDALHNRNSARLPVSIHRRMYVYSCRQHPLNNSNYLIPGFGAQVLGALCLAAPSRLYSINKELQDITQQEESKGASETLQLR